MSALREAPGGQRFLHSSCFLTEILPDRFSSTLHSRHILELPKREEPSQLRGGGEQPARAHTARTGFHQLPHGQTSVEERNRWWETRAHSPSKQQVCSAGRAFHRTHKTAGAPRADPAGAGRRKKCNRVQGAVNFLLCRPGESDFGKERNWCPCARGCHKTRHCTSAQDSHCRLQEQNCR